MAAASLILLKFSAKVNGVKKSSYNNKEVCQASIVVNTTVSMLLCLEIFFLGNNSVKLNEQMDLKFTVLLY